MFVHRWRSCDYSGNWKGTGTWASHVLSYISPSLYLTHFPHQKNADYSDKTCLLTTRQKRIIYTSSLRDFWIWMKWWIDYYYSKYKGRIRPSNVCSINILLLVEDKWLSPIKGLYLCLWCLPHPTLTCGWHLYKCSCRKWPLGELFNGVICISSCFVCCVLTRFEAVTQIAVEFAQVPARRKGLNGFNSLGGVPLVQKSLFNKFSCSQGFFF